MRVKFLDDQNRLIMRNVKGPVREGKHICYVDSCKHAAAAQSWAIMQHLIHTISSGIAGPAAVGQIASSRTNGVVCCIASDQTQLSNNSSSSSSSNSHTICGFHSCSIRSSCANTAGCWATCASRSCTETDVPAADLLTAWYRVLAYHQVQSELLAQNTAAGTGPVRAKPLTGPVIAGGASDRFARILDHGTRHHQLCSCAAQSTVREVTGAATSGHLAL